VLDFQQQVAPSAASEEWFMATWKPQVNVTQGEFTLSNIAADAAAAVRTDMNGQARRHVSSCEKI
jgi:hypothetical protein